MPWDDETAREEVARVEQLLSELEWLPEPARSRALDAVSGVVEVYGEALGRVMAALGNGDRAALGRDELVGHVLLVHDLHPLGTEARVRDALEDVRGAEVVAFEGDTVRVRLDGGGCGSASAEEVEAAIRASAPEVAEVDVEGAPALALPVVRAGGGVPLPMADGAPEGAGP